MVGTIRGTLVSWLALVLVAASYAQDGVSTAGAARTKYLSNSSIFPAPRDVVVEDFINYHRHEIARPKSGEAVALDVRWGNDVASGKEAVLQVGLATALLNDRSQMRPLNLSLVIDKSGSMAADDKLTRVKTALRKLVAALRPSDILSITLFDTSAEVLFPAQEVGDRQRVMDLISEVTPGSSTNIQAGLVTGYEEARKHFDRESTNRVILLTDGIANRGVTDPKRIARDSKEFNDQGIDLSTIGVGLDLNRDLLQDLAKSGRGLFHFVADSEDISKVFDKELQSLLSPVATEPTVEVEFGPGFELDKVYGYDPKRSKGSVKVKLDNLNNGATEVVLLHFKLKDTARERNEMPVKVRLSYFDIERNRRIESSQMTSIVEAPEAGDMLKDPSVEKNYTIGVVAQSIRDMAVAFEAKRYRDAANVLTSSIEMANGRYPNPDDADVNRVVTLASRYRELLREQRAEAAGEDEPEARPVRSIIPNGDFSLGNTGFTSDRPYIKPSTNCLWDGNYTITSRFNAPFQLHTNVPSIPVSAPNGGQMLYMNSGRTESFTVWSAKVRCAPNTTYRITFKEIGLSGGMEWRNLYEIRVNGDRSDPQLGGDGAFVTIGRIWNSGSARNATVSIVRLPNAHGGGVIGIGNIEMVPVKRP